MVNSRLLLAELDTMVVPHDAQQTRPPTS